MSEERKASQASSSSSGQPLESSASSGQVAERLQVASMDQGSAADIPQALPEEEILYDLADLFKVFADTTRIKILYALMDGDKCVASVSEQVGVSQSAVSHQLRLLKQSRLVKFRREGKQIIYSLSDDHVYTIIEMGMSHICE